MRWREWFGVGERRWKKAPDEEVQPGKTLWDWLQLLIVPAILVGVTFVWSASQSRSDNKREDRRIAADRAAAEEARQDATLQGYLDQMSGLMLDNQLLTSKPRDAVRAVARTVTLTALRRLDGERKGAVVRFLAEANLLDRPDNDSTLPPVWLNGADLRGVVLKDAFLRLVDLSYADLTGANLAGAYLIEANLEGANMRRAHLANTTLQDAKLDGADFSGANLRGVDIRGVHLIDRKFNSPLPKGLDLSRNLAALTRPERKEVLDSLKGLLDSLSRAELSELGLTPETLAKFRRDAGAS